jgi:DNA-binding SARP family transcriptional activator/Tfp pilus assembly protein PilF
VLRLDTFGGLTLTSDQGDRPQRRRRLGVLARLAVADSRGVARDELLAMFWPESDGEGARHSLDQLLYEARRSLGVSPTIGTTTLRLDPSVIACDLTDWAAAIDTGDFERAVAVYRGPFLQGFYLPRSHDFERWVESERAAFAAQYRRALETLAAKASHDRKFDVAVKWWRRLAAEDRFGSRTALGLMQAMVDAGDRAGALEFARVHDRIVATELEAVADPAVARYAEMLRKPPSDGRATAAAESAVPTAALTDVTWREDAATLGVAAPSTLPSERRQSRRALFAGATALVAVAIAYGAMKFGRGQAAPNARSSRDRKVASTVTRRPPRGTNNLAAYDLYVHGGDRVLWRSDSGELRAIANLERAVALDSNYAQAYAALARAYGTRSKFGLSLSPPERQTLLARGVAAASRAIALDNSLAEAHADLGYLLSLGLDPLASIKELRRSIALDSTQSEVYNVLAKTYEMADRPDDALAAARRAVATDSMSAAATAELGDALYFTRHYDEALAQLQKVVAVQPPLRRTPSMLAEVYLANHQWKQTMDVLRPIGSTGPMNTGLFGYALARSGRQREARQLLERLLAAKSASAATIADLYIGLRQYDSAFVWLNRSFDDYSMHPKIMGPLFDDVRARPEFARIRNRLGLEAR